MVVELRKSFTNYGSNKRRSCNWVVSHLQITDFYAFYDETNSPLVEKGMLKCVARLIVKVYLMFKNIGPLDLSYY